MFVILFASGKLSFRINLRRASKLAFFFSFAWFTLSWRILVRIQYMAVWRSLKLKSNYVQNIFNKNATAYLRRCFSTQFQWVWRACQSWLLIHRIQTGPGMFTRCCPIKLLILFARYFLSPISYPKCASTNRGYRLKLTITADFVGCCFTRSVIVTHLRRKIRFEVKTAERV